MQFDITMHVSDEGKTATFDATVLHCPDGEPRVFENVARVLELDGDAPGLELQRPLGVRAVRQVLDLVFEHKGWDVAG